MRDVKEIEREAAEVLKVIKGSNGYVEKVKVVEKTIKTSKPKKVFPKTPSMIEKKRCGLGTSRPSMFPLVKDENGDEVIAGTRYSRKRQHYPVGE